LRKRSGKEGRYVFDSSAFFALFENEDGVETVQNLQRMQNWNQGDGSLSRGIKHLLSTVGKNR